MGKVLRYKNKGEQTREHEFDDDIDSFSLTADNAAPDTYEVVIGYREDGENEVVNGVKEVLNEEEFDF